jgi:ABC-type sugar transport system permease subunit
MCFCLAFVQAFSVFPSAVLLGSPAGPTRVISIAAYEAAFEQYDYSLASAIAMIMGWCCSSSSWRCSRCGHCSIAARQVAAKADP